MARVVGAGLIGLASALRLQEAGYCVEIYDASRDEDAASHGNAGHIATEQLSPLASWSNVRRLPKALMSFGGPVGFPAASAQHWLPFGMKLLAACSAQQYARGLECNRVMLLQALPTWRQLLKRTHQEALMSEQGHQLVWETARSTAKGLQAWRTADTGTARVTELDSPALATLQKQFAGKPWAGIQFTGTGHLRDLRAVRAGMREEFVRTGGVFCQRHVLRVRKHAGVAQLILQGDAPDAAIGSAQDIVVVCAGVHSKELIAQDFGKLPMIAERGYHLQFGAQTPTQNELSGPVVFEDRSLIVTPFTHGLRLASFTEFSSAHAPADSRKWSALKRHASDLGVSKASLSASTWLGSRPTLPDYLPAIGRSQNVQNLILATGHNHLGVTLAALTGQLVAQLATRQATSVNLDALSPQRYLSEF